MAASGTIEEIANDSSAMPYYVFNRVTVAILVAAWLGLLLRTGAAFSQEFTLTSAPATNWSCVASSADGKKLVAAVNGGFIYVSTNLGLDWMQTTAPTNSWTALASSADGYRLFASAQNGTGIYRSTNSAATWESTDSGPAGYLACSTDGSIVALADNSVRISTNAGSTWRDLGPWGVPASFIITGVACSADAATLAIVSTWDGGPPEDIQITPSSGWEGAEILAFGYGTCTSIAMSADGSRIVASANNAGYFLPPAACGGSLFSALNFGATVVTNCTAVSNWTSVVCSADGSHLIAAASSGEISHSVDAGYTWQPLNAPKRSWSGMAVSADGTRLIAAANGGGIYIWQRPVNPVLDVLPHGDVLRVSWIIPSADYTLHENSSLTSTNWDAVVTKPNLNLTNLQNEVSLPIEMTNKFYRLKSVNGGT